LVDDATGAYSIVSSGVAATYIVASEAAAAGKSVVGVGKCPDPSSPDGYGPEIVSAPVKIPEFIVLSGPARKINYQFEFNRTAQIGCISGTQVDPAFFSSGTGQVVATQNFVSYKWVLSSVPLTCACSGSSNITTVQPGALVNRANGSQEFLPIGISITTGISASCTVGFTQVSSFREWTFAVTGVLDSSNNPVAPA
jgi:hypothetical protein